MAKKNKLTIKQRLYMKGRLKGMKKADAARAAGYSESMALRTVGIENRAYKNEMSIALAKKGLTSGAMAEILMDGLRAEDGSRGKDHKTRLEFMKLGLELMGWMRKEEEGVKANITINLDGDIAKKYEKRREVEGEVVS